MPAFLATVLTDLGRTVIAGFVLAVILFLLYWITQGYSGADFGPFFLRWLHVLSGSKIASPPNSAASRSSNFVSTAKTIAICFPCGDAQR